ncbi:hypothetical protein PG984_002022, partial [Apiospora sp. TS-2023a]
MPDQVRALPLSINILLSLVISGWSLYYTGFLEVFAGGKNEKVLLVGNFLESKADAGFDGEAIASLCSSKNWTEGLIFNCDAPTGGIGVVRNVHLNCIRFAIEAGAELIIPEIVRRDDRDIAKFFPNPKGPQRGAPPDYFYDRRHLNGTLSTFCPQMKVYWSIDELFDTPMASPIPLRLNALRLSRVDRTVLAQPGRWASQFKMYLDNKSNPKTRLWPLRVNVAQTRYVWPTSYDSPAFARSFGRILRFREDVRGLAASAFFAMQNRLASHGGQNDGDTSALGFVGVHLRAQEDFWDTDFLPYEEQAAHYLRYMVESGYPFAYLAPGASAEHVTSFTERARDFNITVLTKRDLLDTEELGYLSSLSWDQQTLVDYELLLRADLMVGMSDSSFAWNIALSRATAGGTAGSKAFTSRGSQVRWKDARSILVGEPNNFSNMEKATWP